MEYNKILEIASPDHRCSKCGERLILRNIKRIYSNSDLGGNKKLENWEIQLKCPNYALFNHNHGYENLRLTILDDNYFLEHYKSWLEGENFTI